MGDYIEIVCPCCQEKLVVDPETRQSWTKSKKPVGPEKPVGSSGKGDTIGGDAFDVALREVQGSAHNAEDKFKKALEKESHKDEKLDEAFRRAKEEAEKSPLKRPPNPFDWD